MFNKVLIANRGEIACRVAATARRLGIRTVAVYSDADARAAHVAACDEAVRLGPASASESYLSIDRVLAAARATGSQAVHPGYGFLSENEDFARACENAGLVFIGPPVDAIRAMGDKSAAKALMQGAGVPLVPGYHGDEQDAQSLREHAARIGYPVLIKASAGGGGKGMRVVESAAEFDAALASCQREAINAFGDGRVLIEKYLRRARHIEVQVFADTHGQCIHLYERDCSAQRRHQKVIEEAPAPHVRAAFRQAIGEAAVAAARAVNYVGAGTVEFIVEGDAFYFMEMNTRLQVEHPVTECVTGLDLVEWQLRVAAGEPLPRTQNDLHVNGHAIEARLYAENTDKGFLPSTGTLTHLRFPSHHAFAPLRAAGVRIDSGVREGDAITPYYDPMIAKLIAWGPTREHARRTLAHALGQTRIVGVNTNVGFLRRLVQSEAFALGDLDTAWIERHRDALATPVIAPDISMFALACAALLEREGDARDSSPWSSPSGFRLHHDHVRELVFRATDGQHVVRLRYARDGIFIGLAGREHALRWTRDEQHFNLMLNDRVVRGTVVCEGDASHVFTDGEHVTLHRVDPLSFIDDVELEVGQLVAPMPGRIVALLAEPGRLVASGTPLLVMEAMKMEHTITAPASGVVHAFHYAVGDQVAEGVLLVRFESHEPSIAADDGDHHASA
ncbi:MAG TPA: acetyl/propionyl/methylcrotonyl-CoA carboxylase subunit alpha [Burkholderiaceae bacterium]|nr:acetyl/propionyl/methylcrotonyl-CoA carboxylase subunit alpha [Burkholderiaceae bacterium]